VELSNIKAQGEAALVTLRWDGDRAHGCRWMLSIHQREEGGKR